MLILYSMSAKTRHSNPKMYAKKKKPAMHRYIDTKEEGFIEKSVGSWLDDISNRPRKFKNHSYSWERKLQKDRHTKTVGHFKKLHMRYGNLALAILGVAGAIWLVYNPEVFIPIAESESFGLIGAFIMGLLYPAGVTTPASIAGFFILGQSINPVLLALVGAAGAMITDFIIFYFIRHKLVEYLDKFASKYMRANMHLWRHRVNNHPHLKHLLPLFAGTLVASPLPTEIAIGLFAALKFEIKRFMLYTFVFHAISIFIVSQIGSSYHLF